jgi:hypothetical protein
VPDVGADLVSLVLSTRYIHAIRCLVIGVYSDRSKLCRCGVPAVHSSTTGRYDDPRKFRHLSGVAGAYAFPLYAVDYFPICLSCDYCCACSICAGSIWSKDPREVEVCCVINTSRIVQFVPLIM